MITHQDNFNNYTDFESIRNRIIQIAKGAHINKQSDLNDMVSCILHDAGFHGLAEQMKESADYERSRNN